MTVMTSKNWVGKNVMGGLGALALLASALALSACGESQAVFPTKDKGESTPRMSNEKR